MSRYYYYEDDEYLEFEDEMKNLRRQSKYGPHGLWFDPEQRRDKNSNPYNYDSFFIFGDHKSIKGCNASDTDRMASWDYDKFKRACEAMSPGRWDRQT